MAPPDAVNCGGGAEWHGGGGCMDISVKDKGVYAFGPFRLDPVRRTLTRDGVLVKLAARPFDTLLYLIQIGRAHV